MSIKRGSTVTTLIEVSMVQTLLICAQDKIFATHSDLQSHAQDFTMTKLATSTLKVLVFVESGHVIFLNHS